MAFDARTQMAHVKAVADQTARMADAMRKWPSDRWQHAAYCPGWLATDAVAHLATGADFYAQVIGAGRRGEARMPWGIQDAAEFRQVRGAMGQKLIEGSATALLEAFETEAAKLQLVFDTLQASELTRLAWHPRGLVPIGMWIGMRLNELVIHDWDMRQPYEPQAHLASGALSAMCDCLPEMQWQFLSQRMHDQLDGTYVIRTDETAWAFQIEGETVTYHANVPTHRDASLKANAEMLILLTMGRADVETALKEGNLILEGNLEKGQQFCETLFRSF